MKRLSDLAAPRGGALIAVALVAVAAWSPRGAHAELARAPAADPAAARQSFEVGRARYAAGEFRAAAEAFARAYELGAPAALLFNLAQAHRRAGDCPRAHRYYARFIEEVPRSENRAVAASHLRSLAPCAGSPGTATAAPAAASQEPAPPGSPPPRAPKTGAPPAPLAMPAPTPKPTAPPASPREPAPPPASARPAPAAQVAQARPAGAPARGAVPPPIHATPAASGTPAVRVDAQLAVAPGAALAATGLQPMPGPVGRSPVEAPRARRTGLRSAGLITAGSGVVLLVIGASLDAGTPCPVGGCAPAPTDDDDGPAPSAGSDGSALRAPLIASGAALAVAGAGLAVWGHVRGRAPAVAVVPVRGGGVVARAWRF
jgi:hypothetical protein